MSNVTVSVILPTYNGEHYIRKAIESVLGQSYSSLELIVVDDGSTDTTPQIIAEYAAKDGRVRYLRNEVNVGIQRSLNRGLKEARGAWIGRIDDDDSWVLTDKLEKQLAFLENNPAHVLIGTGLIVQDEAGDELYRFYNPREDADVRQRLLYRNCFSHSTVIFNRDRALQIGGYDESPATLHIEDYDLWLRLGQHGRGGNLSDYAVRLTLHDQSISATQKIVQFKKQLELTKHFKGAYPRYFWNRMRSWLRLGLYEAFGAVAPAYVERYIVARYKRR